MQCNFYFESGSKGFSGGKKTSCWCVELIKSNKVNALSFLKILLWRLLIHCPSAVMLIWYIGVKVINVVLWRSRHITELSRYLPGTQWPGSAGQKQHAITQTHFPKCINNKKPLWADKVLVSICKIQWLFLHTTALNYIPKISYISKDICFFGMCILGMYILSYF